MAEPGGENGPSPLTDRMGPIRPRGPRRGQSLQSGEQEVVLHRPEALEEGESVSQSLNRTGPIMRGRPRRSRKGAVLQQDEVPSKSASGDVADSSLASSETGPMVLGGLQECTSALQECNKRMKEEEEERGLPVNPEQGKDPSLCSGEQGPMTPRGPRTRQEGSITRQEVAVQEKIAEPRKNVGRSPRLRRRGPIAPGGPSRGQSAAEYSRNIVARVKDIVEEEAKLVQLRSEVKKLRREYNNTWSTKRSCIKPQLRDSEKRLMEQMQLVTNLKKTSGPLREKYENDERFADKDTLSSDESPDSEMDVGASANTTMATGTCSPSQDVTLSGKTMTVKHDKDNGNSSIDVSSSSGMDTGHCEKASHKKKEKCGLPSSPGAGKLSVKASGGGAAASPADADVCVSGRGAAEPLPGAGDSMAQFEQKHQLEMRVVSPSASGKMAEGSSLTVGNPSVTISLSGREGAELAPSTHVASNGQPVLGVSQEAVREPSLSAGVESVAGGVVGGSTTASEQSKSAAVLAGNPAGEGGVVLADDVTGPPESADSSFHPQVSSLVEDGGRLQVGKPSDASRNVSETVERSMVMPVRREVGDSQAVEPVVSDVSVLVGGNPVKTVVGCVSGNAGAAVPGTPTGSIGGRANVVNPAGGRVMQYSQAVRGSGARPQQPLIRASGGPPAYNRRNVVQLRWSGEGPPPARSKITRLILDMGFKVQDIFALISPGETRDYEVSFVRPEAMDLFEGRFASQYKDKPEWTGLSTRRLAGLIRGRRSLGSFPRRGRWRGAFLCPLR